MQKHLRRWLNPDFTTFLNNLKSKSSWMFSFLLSDITLLITLGGGEKLYWSNIQALIASYSNCVNTLITPYSFVAVC
ncbi:MAG: hypothetical protein R2807_00635 [Chitinophagales bacterium]